jgi:hypothetical protein
MEWNSGCAAVQNDGHVTEPGARRGFHRVSGTSSQLTPSGPAHTIPEPQNVIWA